MMLLMELPSEDRSPIQQTITFSAPVPGEHILTAVKDTVRERDMKFESRPGPDLTFMAGGSDGYPTDIVVKPSGSDTHFSFNQSYGSAVVCATNWHPGELVFALPRTREQVVDAIGSFAEGMAGRVERGIAERGVSAAPPDVATPPGPGEIER